MEGLSKKKKKLCDVEILKVIRMDEVVVEIEVILFVLKFKCRLMKNMIK